MKIKRFVLEKITVHAREHSPIEACGYLAGKGGIVSRHDEMKNIDASGEHFSMDPREQFEVLKNRYASVPGRHGLSVFRSAGKENRKAHSVHAGTVLSIRGRDRKRPVPGKPSKKGLRAGYGTLQRILSGPSGGGDLFFAVSI